MAKLKKNPTMRLFHINSLLNKGPLDKNNIKKKQTMTAILYTKL